MSKYTTEVRYVCEHYAGLDESAGYSSVETVIDKARPKIFDFNYPIFDEGYRAVLEKKILRHYYTREIGFETVGLWKLKLDTRMNEIMPYYNRLYESELLEFDPFADVNRRTEHEGSDRGSRNTDSESTTNVSNTVTVDANSEDWDLYSDTPQGGVTGLDSGQYLSNARKRTGEQDDTTTTQGEDSTTSGTDEVHENENRWVEVVSGKQGSGSYSSLLKEFRETFLNIDMMIIEELNDLFMLIY